MNAPSTVGDVLAWLAASGLPGTLAQAPDSKLDAAGWSRLLELSRRHGLTGLLVHAVETGWLPADAAQADSAARTHHTEVVTTLAAEGLLVAANELLDQAQLPTRVLGAPAVAYVDYHDPSLRPFHVIRLAIRPVDLPRASLALGRLQRGRGPVALHWQTRIWQSQPLVSQRYDALWPDDWSPYSVGESTVLIPPAAVRLIDCGVRAVGDGGDHRLIRDRDIAQILLSRHVETADVVRLATAWGCELPVAEAIDRAWARLRLVDELQLSAWAKRVVRRASGGHAPGARRLRTLGHRR